MESFVGAMLAYVMYPPVLSLVPTSSALCLRILLIHVALPGHRYARIGPHRVDAFEVYLSYETVIIICSGSYGFRSPEGL